MLFFALERIKALDRAERQNNTAPQECVFAKQNLSKRSLFFSLDGWFLTNKLGFDLAVCLRKRTSHSNALIVLR